eukprot:CAMPEP_0167743222 /NCGR_PEP_ID=MMETSP0110_2-20121227/1892_1 /TAXON_ID=629695 /ORGANISM="Gymnochlora sp., Strain CCMP2014" /LENGTH=342 /DNA_ID=CAMNT_0007627561 /DNA_START=12 /DNA_END=1040 /DNA_ORIENTATION=+
MNTVLNTYAASGDSQQALISMESLFQQYPEKIVLLDYMAELHAAQGRFEMAREMLERSLRADPKSSHERWFSYAQLVTNEDAESAYRHGVTKALLKERQKIANLKSLSGIVQEAKDDVIDLQCQLSSAYCALTDLYLTDLRMHPNAQQLGLKTSDTAMKLTPYRFEPYALKASIQYIFGNSSDAKAILELGFSMYEYDSQDEERGPILLKGIKLGMEIGLIKPALKMLEEIIAREPPSGEVAHLSAQCYYLMEDFERAYARMIMAKELLRVENEELLKTESGNSVITAMLQDVEEWIAETREKYPSTCLKVNEEEILEQVTDSLKEPQYNDLSAALSNRCKS